MRIRDSELKTLWRRLLANAYDPKRSTRVRASFIDIAKRLDPYDALVLQTMGEATGQMMPNARDFVMATSRIPIQEIMVSFGNLKDLGLIGSQIESYNPHITDKGSVFLAAVAP